ncbi:inositol-3-phosphate synthase [Actinomycetospora sp. OC33-EN08]|uniref:Inositol-3-phosphate synthase n=1 Tax=Actinomycetospora aurantiaca TaxID=3129233 RepID=A0ABU8MLT3_9PSEU
MSDEQRKVGVAVVGVGGAVSTTAIAGVELLKVGACGTDGLPFADVTSLVPYTSLVFGGWDLDGDDLAKAAHLHRVLEPNVIEASGAGLAAVAPWPAVADPEYCRNAVGANVVPISSVRGRIDHVRADIERFRTEQDLDRVVVVNLASTERWPDLTLPALQTPEAFEQAVDADDPVISPSMVYAYAAITTDSPYVNFTPSASADIPALLELALQRGVPVAGKDGKTGQTMIKTVLAPAFASRSLHVDGWYSTNILGNRDGQVLDDADSLQAKLQTKGNVLDQCLGYHVEDHQVRIDYYKPRGDEKEAWDNVDLTGFLGQKMQIKVDFLCRDSILAAPLVLELARMVDEAARRKEGGAQEQLGYFFKAPITRDGSEPVHALYRQEQVLREWLG